MIDIHIGAEAKHFSLPWDTINTLAPHLIWLFFAIGLLIWFGRTRLDALLARVTKLSIAGIEVELKQTLRLAAQMKK